LAGLAIGSIYTMPWDFPPFNIFLWKYIISFLQIVLLILSVLGIIFGTTIDNIIRKIEVTLSNWISKKISKYFEA
jgi:ABC-type antimicrobial peptide transport system permease subunit